MLPFSVKLALLTLGWLCFILGMIGIFVPGLPTTPFLLITTYCFSKGSKRLHSWLLSHPRLGAPIKSWEEHGVIQKKHKILATTLIVLFFSYTLILVDVALWIKVVVSIIEVIVLTFIWTRLSLEKNKTNHME